MRQRRKTPTGGCALWMGSRAVEMCGFPALRGPEDGSARYRLQLYSKEKFLLSQLIGMDMVHSFKSWFKQSGNWHYGGTSPFSAPCFYANIHAGR